MLYLSLHNLGSKFRALALYAYRNAGYVLIGSCPAQQASE